MQYRCWCPFGDVCSKRNATLAIKKTSEDAKYAILNHLCNSPKHNMEWEAANDLDLDPWITAEEYEVDVASRTESPHHSAQPMTPPRDPRSSASQARPPMSSQAKAGPPHPPQHPPQQKAMVKWPRSKSRSRSTKRTKSKRDRSKSRGHKKVSKVGDPTVTMRLGEIQQAWRLDR